MYFGVLPTNPKSNTAGPGSVYVIPDDTQT